MASLREHTSYMLVRVCRSLRSDRAGRLGSLALHCGQDLVLVELGAAPGLTQAELGARLEVEPPTVTKMMQRMEQAGAVRREPDPEDARALRLYLTHEGQRLLGRVEACWQAVEVDTLKHFTVEERVLLRRFLQQILANLAHAGER